MIRLVPATHPLTPAEQFGWDVLRDLSRVLAADEPGAGRTTPVGGEANSRSPADAAQIGGGDLVVVQFVGDSVPTAPGTAAPELLARLARPLEIRDGLVRVPRGLLQAVADVAGAGVEQRSPATDRHGRVPSQENPLVAAGLERQPVVSTAANALRSAVAQAAGRRAVMCVAPWPDRRRWSAAISHDVDVVAGWPLFAAMRIAELARKKQFRRLTSVVRAAIRSATGDPVLAGVRDVLGSEQRLGLVSTWFLLCGTPTIATFRRGDLTYRPESRRARIVLDAMRAAGDEIGLHGSFATTDDADLLAAQRARLGRLAGDAPAGVRQHYLRMRPGATQRGMVAAGFSYDATYGFPDRNGYRLGVADVVPGWDDAAQRAMPLDEVPLVWMDRAQSKYQNVEDPARWIADATALAESSRRVEGLWVGLWHPNLTAPLGFPGAPSAYAALLRQIAAAEPYVAPLQRIVAWRRLRRAITGQDFSDRVLTLTVPSDRSFDLVIENAAGRSVGTVARHAGADGGAAVTVPVAVG